MEKHIDELDYAELENRLGAVMKEPPNFILATGHKDFLKERAAERRYYPLGYKTGRQGFDSFLKNQIATLATSDEAKQMVEQWRAANQQLMQLWDTFEQMERDALVEIIQDEVIFNDLERWEKGKESLQNWCNSFMSKRVPSPPINLESVLQKKKNKSYGPPKIGKRGKTRRW